MWSPADDFCITSGASIICPDALMCLLWTLWDIMYIWQTDRWFVKKKSCGNCFWLIHFFLGKGKKNIFEVIKDDIYLNSRWIWFLSVCCITFSTFLNPLHFKESTHPLHFISIIEVRHLDWSFCYGTITCQSMKPNVPACFTCSCSSLDFCTTLLLCLSCNLVYSLIH